MSRSRCAFPCRSAARTSGASGTSGTSGSPGPPGGFPVRGGPRRVGRGVGQQASAGRGEHARTCGERHHGLRTRRSGGAAVQDAPRAYEDLVPAARRSEADPPPYVLAPDDHPPDRSRYTVCSRHNTAANSCAVSLSCAPTIRPPTSRRIEQASNSTGGCGSRSIRPRSTTARPGARGTPTAGAEFKVGDRAKGMTPYFIKVQVGNVGGTELSYVGAGSLNARGIRRRNPAPSARAGPRAERPTSASAPLPRRGRGRSARWRSRA